MAHTRYDPPVDLSCFASLPNLECLSLYSVELPDKTLRLDKLQELILCEVPAPQKWRHLQLPSLTQLTTRHKTASAILVPLSASAPRLQELSICDRKAPTHVNFPAHVGRPFTPCDALLRELAQPFGMQMLLPALRLIRSTFHAELFTSADARDELLQARPALKLH